MNDLENIFWQDAGMTLPFEMVGLESRMTVTHRNGIDVGDLVFYIGHPDPLVKLLPASGSGSIVLSIADVFPRWQASQQYFFGQLVTATGAGNGFMYRCMNMGTSGSVEPIWPSERADEVADGGTRWVNIGERFLGSNVKMAKSLAGLDSAVGGGALVIGSEILCGDGTAIAIHVRIVNPSAALRSDSVNPCLAFVMTECEFVENL